MFDMSRFIYCPWNLTFSCELLYQKYDHVNSMLKGEKFTFAYRLKSFKKYLKN